MPQPASIIRTVLTGLNAFGEAVVGEPVTQPTREADALMALDPELKSALVQHET